MRRFKGEYDHFCFNKHPNYTHDGASAKFSTNLHETDNSVVSFASFILVEKNWPGFIICWGRLVDADEYNVIRYLDILRSHKGG